MRFPPLFHAVMAALNVFLVIRNYRLDHTLDAIMHCVFAVNFFIMFLITNSEASNAKDRS